MTAPRWAIAAFRFHLAMRRATVLLQVFLEELICARVPADARPSLTSEIFKRLSWYYAPGGDLYQLGLFDWELAAIERMGLRPGYAVLVGAAGGGREVDALRALGYEAHGFDPSPLADLGAGGDLHRATYADLVTAVTDSTGPLKDMAGRDFDGVILGWGSINHVLTDNDRRDLLTAIRARWPQAGVLLSYQESRDERRENPRLVAVRRRLRARLRTDERIPGVEFLMGGGFMYFPTHDAIRLLADATGYDVLYVGGPYSHDVLAPRHRLRTPAVGRPSSSKDSPV